MEISRPVKRRVVAGIVLAKYPPHSAGHQLSVLHWLLGFRELGWDVWIVENLSAAAFRDVFGNPCAPEISVNVASWKRFVRDHGFDGRESLFVDGKCDNRAELQAFSEDADLFLNYAGQFDVWNVVEKVQRRAYLDVDPGYTQAWASAYGCDMHLDHHDFHVTIGCACNEAWCRIPQTGHDWIPTLPPVSLSYYERLMVRKPAENPAGPWTTVTHWYGAAPIEVNGLSLLGKRESFLPLRDLPSVTGRRFVIATDLQQDWEDFAPFSGRGWEFEKLGVVCDTMESYLHFIRQSAGELGVAKHGYIATRSGWLSDRSLAYLACGIPVVAADTGWTRILGEFPGLRAFSDKNEATTAIRDVAEDYPAASRSALELTERLFDARRVISNLLQDLEVPISLEEMPATPLPVSVA